MRSILSIALILMAAPQRGAADANARLRALAPDVVDGPTTAQQVDIESRLARRIAYLQRAGKLDALPSTDGTGLQWPLRPAPGFSEYGYYGTSNFPDHDPRFPDLLQDYTCGTRTYDLATGYNHHGTDYYLWPYPWRMMDLEQVHIVAAAAGVIVDKVDGNSDRSCAITGNTGFNAVYVRQDDGLVIIDAPISAGYSRRVLDEAARRFPGMKVKALITSTSWGPLIGQPCSS